MEREQTTIRLPAELLDKLRQEAARRGYSFNGFLVMLVNIGWNSYSSSGT